MSQAQPFPQALIFDVDGTLADNERDGHRVAFNRAFAAAGLDWAWSESRYGELLKIGGGKERIRHYITTAQPQLPRESQAPGFVLDEFIKTLHLSKSHFYQQLLSEGAIPLRPGVLRLLQVCKAQGVRLAIATTSALPNALALIETIAPDAKDWFEVIAAGDMVPAKKPAPDIYKYALQQLQLSARDCIAIEDSKPGCEAAIAAGIQTLVTINGYTRQEDFPGAALVVSHLGEPNTPCQILGGQRAAAINSPSHIDLSLLAQLHP